MLFYKIFNKESISSSGWSKVKGSRVPGYNCRHHQWQIFNECLLYLESCVMSVAVVLKWGSFCLRSLSGEHFSVSGDIFNCHSWGWGDTAGTYWAEVRDPANIYSIKGDPFQQRITKPKMSTVLVYDYEDIEPGPLSSWSSTRTKGNEDELWVG